MVRVRANNGKVGSNKNLLVAISSDSIIITKHSRWDIYSFPPSVVSPFVHPQFFYELDYQQLAYDQYNIYINVDIIANFYYPTYAASSALVIPKGQLLGSTPVALNTYR